MSPSPVRHPRLLELHRPDAAGERRQAIEQLLQSPACISPKYFYDRLGSHLFEAITELPEYYPTRAEAALLEAHGAEMAAMAGSDGVLIDLGAGNCKKAEGLFPLLEPRRYVAIDISTDFLSAALRGLQPRHAMLHIVGIRMDFTAALELPPGLVHAGERPVFFFPGSSIGNFTPEAAVRLLSDVRRQAVGGGLLIGVDLVKAKARLDAAYDDAIGVTAAFNLNALRHLNRVIGSDFDPRGWQHRAWFNEEASRVEMHLEARGPVLVSWPGGSRRFDAGERIHSENSYKHTVEGFGVLLREAGFRSLRSWASTGDDAFALFWAEGGQGRFSDGDAAGHCHR